MSVTLPMWLPNRVGVGCLCHAVLIAVGLSPVAGEVD